MICVFFALLVDHRGGAGSYFQQASALPRDDDDMHTLNPTGDDKAVEYFFASDAR